MARQTHALTLIATPEFRVAKDQLKKLQEAAIAQAAAVNAMERKAAMGGVLTGLTLLRVKATMGHGGFGKWVETKFAPSANLKHRQANYMMRLAQTFLEKCRVQKPDLLALPGDQTALDLGDGAEAKALFTKLGKFVGECSLNELLVKYGIKGVVRDGDATDEDGTATTTPGQAEDYFAAVAESVLGWRNIVTNREALVRLTPQQLETLNESVSDGYAQFRKLYEEARGKTRNG